MCLSRRDRRRLAALGTGAFLAGLTGLAVTGPAQMTEGNVLAILVTGVAGAASAGTGAWRTQHERHVTELGRLERPGKHGHHRVRVPDVDGLQAAAGAAARRRLALIKQRPVACG